MEQVDKSFQSIEDFLNSYGITWDLYKRAVSETTDKHKDQDLFIYTGIIEEALNNSITLEGYVTAIKRIPAFADRTDQDVLNFLFIVEIDHGLCNDMLDIAGNINLDWDHIHNAWKDVVSTFCNINEKLEYNLNIRSSEVISFEEKISPFDKILV